MMKFKFVFKNLFASFIKFFSIKNIIKILLLFFIGFLGRIIIVNLFNIDVFYDYTSLYSILYYIHMSIFSISLSEFFATISDIRIGDIVKSIRNFITLIYDKYYMTLGSSTVDTKPYKEIKSVGRKNICAMDNNGNVGGSGSSNNNNNLGESSRFRGKVNDRASDMVPVDPSVTKLEKIVKDLDYKDSIINDKRINNTDKLKRLQLSDSDPGKSDSSGDAERVKEIKRVLHLKRKALESNMDPEVKLEILENLSDRSSRVYEERARSRIPETNLEQNPLISSQSYPDLRQATGIPPRNITASNLDTRTE